MDRSKKIIRISVYGIIVNFLLVLSKITVGLISGSLAIILDAINNFSDAFSSVITIIGTKLANRPADRSHPFGYGRIEYLTSTIISVIILYTGFSALTESIDKVFHPSPVSYNLATFIVLILAIVVKLVFGIYLKKSGSNLNAQSLIASGTDAVMDSLVSLATLISALVYTFFKLDIDGYLGIIISALILKTGFEILSESIGSLVGKRTEGEIASKIYKEIDSFKEVLGAYDLILHDYGPDEMIGSIHIEVSDQYSAKKIDELSRKIATKIYTEFGIILTIGIYASNTENPEFNKIKNTIRDLVLRNPHILQMHGFYIDEKTKNVTFDIIIDFKAKNPKEIVENLRTSLKELYPAYTFNIVIDTDFSTSEK